MEELIWQPLIISAAAAPNPTKVGDKVKIVVKVIDRLGGEQSEDWFAGDIWSGEV